MNTRKLLQKILKDVCSEKFSTKIRYGSPTWSKVKSDERWNGFEAVTQQNVLYFIWQPQMFLDWKTIRRVDIPNEPIINILNNYTKRLTEVNVNGETVHRLHFKRIEKMKINNKDQDVAIFDYLNNEEIAIKMEYLQYFDLDSIKLISSENQYSPIVIIEDDLLAGIVMPVLR